MKAQNWIDRVTGPIAPMWTLRRVRARIAAEQLARHYEGASRGRRTQGWRKSSGDANAVIGPAITLLRENARDLVRNNPYAESALGTIADHAVGFGIVATPSKAAGKEITPAVKAKALAAWQQWAETTACDADGRHDFYGLQKLVMRTIVESGEVLIRRRIRFESDGMPLNMQIQILDPDFIDTSKDLIELPNGAGQIIQGVEFDPIGRRSAYWLFPEHPGSMRPSMSFRSARIPAESVLHVFKPIRPGQVRAPSWFAPVLLRFKDFDEFEDATLMKQKIAACLSVLTTDVDGSAPALGSVDPEDPTLDQLGPGAVLNVPSGRDVKIVDPPQARDYAEYSKTQLRAIATGLGVPYEELTGDYGDMPFSAARMSRIRHWGRVEDWRWRILIPQFCDPVYRWAMDAAAILGQAPAGLEAVWTAPPAPMVDPVNEGLAYSRNIRAGVMSWQEMARERGYDPDALIKELTDDAARFDDNELILDCDARNTTQAGQLQGEAAAQAKAAAAPAVPALPVAAPGARGWSSR